ncbi:glycosyltransferase family 2 protein [Enterococcus faecium]|uniref:glycosyltransferase family 2 protein n=1 Tax=Enterococcus TaxID=1350 RepID=UPI000B7147B7|nr:glycosyltransferase family A protein [Enterococcus faecium]MDQ8395664.1 glycosyltransferase family A protein [Enterococcus faecium]NTK68304.1 glycosyltransferase family 2 protein [Enterococcus faecium]OTN70442.1 hypothetical protein A5827_000808 [Enterococcus faecium]UQR32314.1 glycosyltransferase family 2 protein [Enterococcus faecium]
MISIITATYNRAHTLPFLYDSLNRQTSKLFEWIIIDDGSQDSTRDLIESFTSINNEFSIKYEYKKNGGKHTAINMGVKIAKGEYIFIVDSDDQLTPDAIETIENWIDTLQNSSKIVAVAGTRGNFNGKRIGDYPKKYHNSYIDVKNTERRKYKLLGDKAEVYRTEILRKYPFPVFSEEKFLTESSVWDEIAYQGYYVRWYDKVIYLCEYLEHGLTKCGGDKRDLTNFEGFTYSTKQRIKCNNLLEGLIAAGRYVYIAKKKGVSICVIKKKLNCSFCFIWTGQILWKIKNTMRKKKYE